MKSAFKYLAIMALLASCAGDDKKVEEQVARILENNPEIIIKALEKKPYEFMESLQKIAKSAQSQMAQRRAEEEKKELEESFDNPKVPSITDNDNIRGDKNAPITLVEFSDFECPFCSRGYDSVVKLMEKYEGKIKFVYKHLPLEFHPNAMTAAMYMEALKIQSMDKGWKFHDTLFKNQSKVKNGENYFKSVAKDIGADMKKLQADLKSEKIKNKIQADMQEAQKLGFSGTPGFLLNGVPVSGALPPEHFVQIIDELQKRGKVNL